MPAQVSNHTAPSDDLSEYYNAYGDSSSDGEYEFDNSTGQEPDGFFPENSEDSEAQIRRLFQGENGPDPESLDYLQELSEIEEQTVEEPEIEEPRGDSPTRVENNVNIFESQTGDGFYIVAEGKGSENRVDTAGEVTISPLNPDAPVEVTEAGGLIVVKVGEGGKKDVYKISSKAIKIHIESDKVSGDFENSDGIVTVGPKGEKYISSEKIGKIVEKVKQGERLVGGLTGAELSEKHPGRYYRKASKVYELPPNAKYSAAYAAQNENVKKVLGIITDALEEKDPKEKGKLWEGAFDELMQWTNQKKLGRVNDGAALLCRVLHDQFGEEGFKSLLKEGFIPKEFAQKLSDLLTLDATEIYSQKDAKKGFGEQGWTHGTYAEFLRKYSSTS